MDCVAMNKYFHQLEEMDVRFLLFNFYTIIFYAITMIVQLQRRKEREKTAVRSELCEFIVEGWTLEYLH